MSSVDTSLISTAGQIAGNNSTQNTDKETKKTDSSVSMGVGSTNSNAVPPTKNDYKFQISVQTGDTTVESPQLNVTQTARLLDSLHELMGLASDTDTEVVLLRLAKDIEKTQGEVQGMAKDAEFAGVKAQLHEKDKKEKEVEAERQKAAKRSKIAKLFSKIAGFLGAIATIIGGAALFVANPVAGAAVMAIGGIMAANEISKLASDKSMFAHMGMSANAEMYLMIGLTVAAAAFSIGGALVRTAAQTAASAAAKAMIKEASEEIAKVATKEITKEAAEQAIKTTFDKIIKEAVQKLASKGVSSAVTEAAEKAMKEASEEIMKAAFVQIAEATTTTVTAEVAKTALKEAVKESLKGIIAEARHVGTGAVSASTKASMEKLSSFNGLINAGMSAANAGVQYSATQSHAEVKKKTADMKDLDALLEALKDFLTRSVQQYSSVEQLVQSMIEGASEAAKNKQTLIMSIKVTA